MKVSSSCILAAVVTCVLVSLGQCGNHTVTEEVWFDVEIKDFDGAGEDYRGRFVVGLFGDTAPMTCLNFVSLTKGFKRGYDRLSYKNTIIHRIVPDFVFQMGDVTVGDGTGGKSIYGEKFVDENFILSHKSAGFVSMANNGKDSNGSQFFVLLNRARWLDGKHVVFGKVVRGMHTVNAIGETPTDKETAVPKKRVKIIDCGVVGLEEKYTLTEDQILSDKDVDKYDE